jgi:hypothetical protein
VHWQPETGRFKDHKCALFNGNTSEIITAVLEDHTFMEVGFTHIGWWC